MCSLEVPDSAAIYEGYDPADVQPFLINVEESAEQAFEFVDSVGLTLTCLLDEDGALYNGYDLTEMGMGGAPFLIHVVIDRAGVITYFDRDAEPALLREAIDAAL